MSARDGKARWVLVLLVLVGLGLLAIPFFLTPPALLEIVPRDTVFAADLGNKTVRVTDDASGKVLTTTIEKAGAGFLAQVGRINSGPGSFTVELDGYEPATATIEAPPLRTVRAALDLVPNFGRLEVSLVSSTQAGNPVAATLKEGSSTLAAEPRSLIAADLPPGKHRLSASAGGFCSGEREVQVAARKLTKMTFPLSPDLTGNEIARLVLDWGENPRDLDAHFRKLGTSGSHNSAHVFYAHKQGLNEAKEQFAVLDVDYRQSEGYETVTISDKAEGDYEYYVDLYAGEGTLGSSGAQAEVLTPGCHRRLYSVPQDCAQRIWAVAHLRVHQRKVEIIDQQRCEKGVPLELGGKAPTSP